MMENDGSGTDIRKKSGPRTAEERDVRDWLAKNSFGYDWKWLKENLENFSEIFKWLQDNSKNLKWLLTHLRNHEQSGFRYQNYFIANSPIAANFEDDFYHDDSDCSELDPYVELGDPRNIRVFSISGTSMKDAGMYDGDKIFVKVHPFGVHPLGNNPPANGDVVVVSIEGKLTVKAYRRGTDGKAIFVPANSTMESVEPEKEGKKFHIVGPVSGLLRSKIKPFPIRST
jgi:SOS-response transcriptional repressor LexA